MSESYSNFARIYDFFMEDIPYREWADLIISILKKNNIKKGELIADLGCGTGVLTRLLKDSGYDMIGIDSSPEMLDKALEAEYEKEDKSSILYLNQDMREFELYGTVKAIICSCDSINYLTQKEDILQCMRLVNNYLDPSGLFIFDFVTPDRYKEIADSIIADNRKEGSFIWENKYFPDTHINECELTLFIQEKDDLYRKSTELHIQRGYSLEEMLELLEKANLEYIENINLGNNRIMLIASEKGKDV